MISFLKANAVNLALGALLVGWVSIAAVSGSCPTCVVPQLVAGLFAAPEAAAAEVAPAPSWALEDIEGDVVSSVELAGNVQVLTFFSRTCAPCRAELGYLDALHAEYGARGVRFVALNVDADATPLAEFARRLGIDFTVARGGSRVAGTFGGVSGVPTTFVLDRSGRIVSRYDGLTSRAALERAIAQAM